MNPNRATQCLNGWWDYRIGQGRYCKKQVPYSDAPVGYSECRLEFDLDRAHENKRVFLVFEGITYRAEVNFNGKDLGEMLPYSEYRFDVTDDVKKTGNVLSVEIYDTSVYFGAGEGWENYSGITRDVYLEYTEQSVLENVFWHSHVTEDLSSADCVVEITSDIRDAGLSCDITLLDPAGKAVYSETKAISEKLTEVRFAHENPILWSPDAPILYTLQVKLNRGETVCDTYTTPIGFKHLVTKGNRFFLNGEPMFLLGVCRHEFWGDNGHMITDEQIEEDLRIIKDLGCNYVRLVHYPHRKITVELADKLGLFVSEEPGLWWDDMTDQTIVDASLDVLRRTILRDRNNVSVAFWLSFNECKFTPEFIRDSAATCRKYDPYRLVSGANCMDIPMTKKYFKECGFDFYTMHPYCYSPHDMRIYGKELTDMPLVFTEWGGWYIFDDPYHLTRQIEEIARLWHNAPHVENGGGALAGASFWMFSQMYEINRAAPVCYGGLQHEYLVDRFRRPSLNYDVFKKEFKRLMQKEWEPERSLDVIPFACSGALRTLPLSSYKTELQQATWEAVMTEAKKPIPKFYHGDRRTRNMTLGPTVPFEIRSIGDLPVDLEYRPLVVAKDCALDIAVGDSADTLHLIGMTSLAYGYPTDGAYGDEAIRLNVRYTDGTEDTHIFRNGFEITTACSWYGPSRINPVAANAPRALYFINDPDRERFVANRLALCVCKDKKIASLHFEALTEQYNLLLYGITLQSH